jgi:ABC-type dipeptide/oligopeptide/nickel transport system permease component
MTAYLVRRLAALLPTLLGVITLAFLLIRLAPGDPALILQQEAASGSARSAQAFRREHALDRPVVVQYALYVRNVLGGRLGISFRSRQPVMDEIRTQIRPTVLLALAGTTVAVAVGVPAGVLAALRRTSIADYATMILAMISLASPSFWLAALLLYVFSFTLGWFPFFGSGDGSVRSTVAHLALPACAIGLRAAALIARMTRSSILQVLGQDFVRTAWAKGVRGSRVIARHVMGNAAIPIVTIVGLDIAYLLGGSVIVETIFSRPGLGKLLVDAIYARDYPMVQAAILIFAVFVVGVNLMVDVLYASLDPRIRYA